MCTPLTLYSRRSRRSITFIPPYAAAACRLPTAPSSAECAERRGRICAGRLPFSARNRESSRPKPRPTARQPHKTPARFALAAVPDAALVDGPWLAETLRLQQQRAHAEVVVRCETALKNAPHQANVLNLLSAALLAQGKTRDGIRHLRNAIDADPSAKAHAQLGNVLAATGDFDGAIASYRAALALEPESVEAWSTLGALLKALARYAKRKNAVRRDCASIRRMRASNTPWPPSCSSRRASPRPLRRCANRSRPTGQSRGAQRAAAHAVLFGYYRPRRRIP